MLSFWTANQGLFPQLFALGQDLTAAPASQAYCERIFSICGDMTVGKRNRMTKSLWLQQIWAENWGGLCPFWERGSWVPNSLSNTMWPGTRPTCMPSFILIRPTVWPQCTNVTDRTDRQTDGTDKRRTDSTGRTVLQTVAQLSYGE